MKKITKALLKFSSSLLVVVNTTSAIAQDSNKSDSGIFVQVGVATLNYHYDNTYTYDLGTTYALYGGFNINQYLAIEALYGTASTSTYSTTLNFGGLYIKPKLPLTENFELFGRIGSNRMTISNNYNSSTSNTYKSYGGGITAYIDSEKKYYLSAEYMVWAESGLEKLTGTSIAFGARF